MKNKSNFKKALEATANKRGILKLMDSYQRIILVSKVSNAINIHWNSYQKVLNM